LWHCYEDQFCTLSKVFCCLCNPLCCNSLFVLQCAQASKGLPIYQPAEVSFELVDSTLQHVKKYHKIAPFHLFNQNGKVITQRDYEDLIYVADFFFTTCPSICPIMTDNMARIQTQILEDDKVKVVVF
jgi:protein SCO1/2